MVAFSAKKPQHSHRLFESKSLTVDASQQEQLRCLEFQGRLTQALLGYAGAITSAFEFLGQAHAAMEMEGACKVDGTGITEKMLFENVDGTGIKEKMLFESFRDAHATACYLAGAARMSLETSRSTLQACAQDLEKADEAAAQVERYNKQLQACKRTDSASRRSKRVQAKLDPAVHLADVSLTRAQDSLNGCVSRQGELCQVARQLIGGTGTALRDAIRPLQLQREQACKLHSIARTSEVSMPSTPSSFEAALATTGAHTALDTTLRATSVSSTDATSSTNLDATDSRQMSSSEQDEFDGLALTQKDVFQNEDGCRMDASPPPFA